MTPTKEYPSKSLDNVSAAGYARELIWKNEKRVLLKIGSIFVTATIFAAPSIPSTRRIAKCLGKSVFGPTAMVAAVVLGLRCYFWSVPAYQWYRLYQHLAKGGYDEAIKIFESFVDQQKLKDITEENVWQKTQKDQNRHPFIKSRFATSAFYYKKTKELSHCPYTGSIDRMQVLDTVMLLKRYISDRNEESKSIKMAFLAGGDFRGSPYAEMYQEYPANEWQKEFWPQFFPDY